jgi:hypothetical protein
VNVLLMLVHKDIRVLPLYQRVLLSVCCTSNGNDLCFSICMLSSLNKVDMLVHILHDFSMYDA